ncbi:MAG TPA: TerC family protein [Thermoanaerobaculia bacterium]|nr:TerC family protein [Thermoanaerobaculia bacterium]
MPTIGSPLLWGLFLALVLVLLALDLGVIHRRQRSIGIREAIVWSLVWTVAALGFNLWLALRFGRQAGVEFLAGYVIERSLSFDNIFVFVVLFHYFSVPDWLHHRVLFWGILGALVARGVFIALGAALLSRFDWLLGVLGVFLVYTGVKVFRGGETRVEPERNPVLRFFRRFVPMTADYQGRRFLLRREGRLLATPLLLVVAVVETTDVLFAVDSIPAVFGVTRDSFIVFTSNIFAILGLRALYFLLAGLMVQFHYLGYGLGVVLAFVGAKMVLHPWLPIRTEWSLAVVLTVLALSVAASILFPRPGPVPDEPGDDLSSPEA